MRMWCNLYVATCRLIVVMNNNSDRL